MPWKVLIAHADGEEELAEQLAEPLRIAGYEVAHKGTVLVGESVVEEASKVLSLGGPVVLCGTVKAVGTRWGRRLVNSARSYNDVRVFAVQMDEEADVEALAFDEKIALYWQDRNKAITDLLASLSRYYPLNEDKAKILISNDAEQRYRALLLETCDIVNMGNLPEDRRLAQRELKLRLLYIPLRVWVDVKAGKEDVEVTWDKMEKRRAASLRGITRIEEIESDRMRVPVGERLAKARRLVVLGDPGSGKTTLTRWIATAYLLRMKKDSYWYDLPDVKTIPDLDYFPIIIRCRDLDKRCLGGVLDDLLRHTLRKNQLMDTEAEALKALLIERVRVGTALLILDGLDEITDPMVRACFCQQLEQIHIAFPSAPIIATSRIVGYREMGYRIGRGFEHVTLADLSRDEKDNFARRWCDLIELPERRVEAAEELIHDIHSSDRIERMTGNPMLLTTMALVKRKVGKLPSRRADLYWEAVQVLLNWRSDVDESLDPREAIPQLEYIAYAMCDRGVQQLRKDEVLDLIIKMRIEYPNLHEIRNHTPELFLHHLEARTALLVEAGKIRYLGMDMPVYEFRHLTFQEYLAARALVDGRIPGRDAKRPLAEQVATLAGRTTESLFSARGKKEVAVTESWRETLRLCTAICSDDDVDSVIYAILNPLKGETDATYRARAIMAALCVADEPNVSEETVRRVFRAFSRQVRDSDGSSLIILTGADAVAVEMAKTRWARMLNDCLIEEMLQRNGYDRTGPAFLCGAIGATSASEDPVKLKKWLRDLTVRVSHGTEADVIEIGSIIYKMTNPRDFYNFSAALGVSGILDTLQSRLGESPNMDFVLAAVFKEDNIIPRGCWRPNIVQIENIISYISNSKSDPLAVSYLCNFVGHRRILVAIEPLIARLDDSDANVRSSAARALGEIGSDRAIEPLIARLDDSDANVRSSAARALGEIGSDRAIELLIARLDDSDANVRSSAARALGEIGSDRAIEPLIARLDDSDANVRSSAARALGEIGSDRAIEPLIARLDDSDANVRSSAAMALSEIKSDRAIEPLIARLNDSDADVRSSAAMALSEIKSDRAIEPLIARLDDPEWLTRFYAARALGEIGSDRAIELLIARLNNSDANVRSSAAEALGEIGSDRAIEPLIARLDDSDANVRSSAAEALSEIGSDRAIEPLIARLDDSDANVRSSAAMALSEIKSDRAIEPLIARLDDPEWLTRFYAARALGEIGSDRAIEPLIALLDDSDINLRRIATIALGNIGGDRVTDLLIHQLNDSNVSVQSATVIALGEIGSDRAIEPLISRLNDLDGSVREEAVGALLRGLNEIDQKLLSRNIDGMFPFLDPSMEISTKFAARAAETLGIKVEDVMARYEALAERFHLHLAWRVQD